MTSHFLCFQLHPTPHVRLKPPKTKLVLPSFSPCHLSDTISGTPGPCNTTAPVLPNMLHMDIYKHSLSQDNLFRVLFFALFLNKLHQVQWSTKWKESPHNGKNICKSCVSDKELIIFRIYKELLQLGNKNPTNNLI